MNAAEAIMVDSRLAGGVIRYHTWPTIRNQTVAEHTWNLLRIYFCVSERPSLNVIQHIMFHDIGEITTGDIPYPLKANNESLKSIMDTIEEIAITEQSKYWHCPRPTNLSSLDRTLVKQIELMEMAEFGMDELLLGNSHGFAVADRCLRALYETGPCNRLIWYATMRLDLFFDQSRINTGWCQGPDLDQTTSPVWWNSKRWEKLYHDDPKHTEGTT